MAWAEITSSRASGGASTGATTVEATFGASIPTGSLMWAAVVYESGGGGNITSVAGGASGNWTNAAAERQILGPDVWLSLWTAVASSAAAHTVTATFNVSRNTRGIFIGALSGNKSDGALNAALSAYQASTSAPSVTISTTVDGCLLLGVSINNNAAGATAGSGFSTVVTGGGPDYPIAFEWKEQATLNASTAVDFTALSGTPGFSITGAAFEPAAAAGTTFYLTNSTASSSNFGTIQVTGSAPSASTTSTGWTVDTVASSNYALMAWNTERASTAFGGTALPSTSPNNTTGDCFRTATALTGDFATGTWAITIPVIAVTGASGQDGRVRIRLWKSSNADGSSATEITAGAVTGTTVTDLTTGAEQTSVATTSSITGFSLSAEYLFLQVAWEITGAAT